MTKHTPGPWEQRFNIPALMLLLLGLTACATAVTSVSEDHVTISYDMILDSDEKLMALALKECRRYGKVARFESKTAGEGLGGGYAHYSCVLSESN